MSTTKKILYELIEDMPEKEITQIIDYVQFLKLKKKELLNEILYCSESSLEFWNNDIDDEVWNDV